MNTARKTRRDEAQAQADRVAEQVAEFLTEDARYGISSLIEEVDHLSRPDEWDREPGSTFVDFRHDDGTVTRLHLRAERL